MLIINLEFVEATDRSIVWTGHVGSKSMSCCNENSATFKNSSGISKNIDSFFITLGPFSLYVRSMFTVPSVLTKA